MLIPSISLAKKTGGITDVSRENEYSGSQESSVKI